MTPSTILERTRQRYDGISLIAPLAPYGGIADCLAISARNITCTKVRICVHSKKSVVFRVQTIVKIVFCSFPEGTFIKMKGAAL